MHKVFLSSILLLMSSLVTYGQKQKLDALQQCQSQWKYENLEKSFTGSIIFFDQPAVMCGVVSTASVALIKKDNGDTVRVLTMCNIKKDFNTPPNLKTGERVIVTSSGKPSFRIDIMPVDFASCRLKTAYFGLIQKAE
jgi:hypothetical protein